MKRLSACFPRKQFLRLFVVALTAAALVVAGGGMAAAALAGTTAAQASSVDRAVRTLAEKPIFVHPDAEPTLTKGEARQLRSAMRRYNSRPVLIALLPPTDSAGQEFSTAGLGREIGTRVHREGTYVVISGRRIDVASSWLKEKGLAQSFMNSAVEAHREDGLHSILTSFIRRLGKANDAQIAAEASRKQEGGSLTAVLVGFGAVLLVVVSLFAGFGIRKRRRRRAEFLDLKAAANEEVIALGQDIRELELDIDISSAESEARPYYQSALAGYELANKAQLKARQPRDVSRVTEAVQDGRYAIACTRAVLAGEPIPERTAPCFFDPRHGPSVQSVEWAPPGGVLRSVPACAADAQAVESGIEPYSRELTINGRKTPYWDAPSNYSPWAGGYYGAGGNGLFEGMLIGSMFSGGFGHHHTVEHHYASGDSGWSGDSSGGWSGGDFGGGDFGGGDFGGGDFGGGGDF